MAQTCARTWVAILVVLLAASLASCSSPGATSCGAPFTLHSPHGTTALGSCSGNPGTAPTAVRIRKGQMFEIDSITEQGGAPDFHAPATDDPLVVARVGLSGQGGDGLYEAVGAGVATLSTGSIYCLGGPTAATTKKGMAVRVCPVLRVTVTGFSEPIQGR